MAPTIPPIATLPISANGDVRFGVFGSLSPIYSPSAAAVNSPTDAGCLTHDAHVPVTGSFPIRANQATTAIGVNDRNPALTPRSGVAT